MTWLHLVRHGLPDIRRQLPAREWTLSPDAQHGLLALRNSGVLPAGAVWFSSPEPKAMETARFLSEGVIVIRDGFREQVRSASWLSGGDLRSAVRRAFENPHQAALPGWEPLDRTRRRVTSAARRPGAEGSLGTPEGEPSTNQSPRRSELVSARRRRQPNDIGAIRPYRKDVCLGVITGWRLSLEGDQAIRAGKRHC
jgi:hypothetical protein